MIVGLDYGSRRIGIACSDELQRFAEPVGFVLREGDDRWLDKLSQAIQERGADRIVVGIPRRTTGELRVEAQRVEEFISQLKEKTTQEIVRWDERFTTKEAERILRENEVHFTKRKFKRDAIAAAVLLQNYLDFLRSNQSHE